MTSRRNIIVPFDHIWSIRVFRGKFRSAERRVPRLGTNQISRLNHSYRGRVSDKNISHSQRKHITEAVAADALNTNSKKSLHGDEHQEREDHRGTREKIPKHLVAVPYVRKKLGYTKLAKIFRGKSTDFGIKSGLCVTTNPPCRCVREAQSDEARPRRPTHWRITRC